MGFFYSVYGLHVSSNLPLPGLVPSPGTVVAETRISLGDMPPAMRESLADSPQVRYVDSESVANGEPVLRVWKLAGGAFFRFRYWDGPEFIVDRAGAGIWATWPSSASVSDTAIYLLGPILGFVLRLRGVNCLHASAVAFSGRAVAMLGPPGAGKSTIAAAFAARGFPVLSDDIVALEDQGDAFLVQPGYPRVNLWPDSVRALYGAPDKLPRIPANWGKHFLDLTKDGYRFQQVPLPLAAIYILGDGTSAPGPPVMEAVPGRDGLMAFVSNAYVNYLLDGAMRAGEFDLAGRIVSRIPVRRVCARRDPASLCRIPDAILGDLERLKLPTCP